MKKIITFFLLLVCLMPAYSAKGLVDDTKYLGEANDAYLYVNVAALTEFITSSGVAEKDLLLLFGEKQAQSIAEGLRKAGLNITDFREVMCGANIEQIQKQTGFIVIIRMAEGKAKIPAELKALAVKEDGLTLYPVDKKMYFANTKDLFIIGDKAQVKSFLSGKKSGEGKNSGAKKVFAKNLKGKDLYLYITLSAHMRTMMDSGFKMGAQYGKGLERNIFLKSLRALASFEMSLRTGKQADVVVGMTATNAKDGERLMMVSHFMIVASSVAVSFMDMIFKNDQKAKALANDRSMEKIQDAFGRIRTKQAEKGVLISYAFTKEEKAFIAARLKETVVKEKENRVKRLKAKEVEDLILAGRFGMKDKAAALIEKGVNVNSKNASGTTALIAAIESGSADMAAFLIDKGADVNASVSGNSCLHAAAEGGNLEIVKLLAAKGANVHALDSNGQKPYDRAVEKGNKAVMEFFEKNYQFKPPVSNDADTKPPVEEKKDNNATPKIEEKPAQ